MIFILAYKFYINVELPLLNQWPNQCYNLPYQGVAIIFREQLSQMHLCSFMKNMLFYKKKKLTSVYSYMCFARFTQSVVISDTYFFLLCFESVFTCFFYNRIIFQQDHGRCQHMLFLIISHFILLSYRCVTLCSIYCCCL